MDYRYHEIHTLVIGTGCAGYNAADCLYDLHVPVAIATEGRNMGTSRNTGSDKQTYYKLSLASDESDSVGEMAQTLAGGIGVHGDIALVEAANSLKCFFKLVSMGVPFPTNEYGEYVGYKTDHDPRRRATSAGPLTSKYMTECLEKSVLSKKIPIFDQITIIKIITEDKKVVGALGVDKENIFHLFACQNVVLATGGPASVYRNSVYPYSQSGMTGIALEAGAMAINLQEWQYGMASVRFRWNVSGTYQQVLPRYISIAEDGTEYEFLNDYVEDPFQCLNMEFLKGYQWPFDMRKIEGSTQIDMMVHHEIFAKKRKVYLDFRRNPSCIDRNGFSGLGMEAHSYLKKSGALFGTPIERLNRMNPEAVSLYQRHKIDLYQDPLEIAVCAQHCNGGISVDIHWESSISGLYVVGEAAGTFGVYRPGGAALNSTQVGSMRAAEHIAEKGGGLRQVDKEYLLGQAVAFIEEACKITPVNSIEDFSGEMSHYAAQIRDFEAIKELKNRITTQLQCGIPYSPLYRKMFKCRDMMITQAAVLSAMESAAEIFGSRGSALVLRKEGNPISILSKEYNYAPARGGDEKKAILTAWRDGNALSGLEEVRPMPKGEDWFENVWDSYLKRIKRRVYRT